MTKLIPFLALAIGFMTGSSFASQLGMMELPELLEKSELVVVARVEKVSLLKLDSRQPAPYDEAVLIIANVMKGDPQVKNLTIILEARGVRGFDPSLRIGQSGVFFLQKNSHGRIRTYTPGSIALFENNNFVVTK
ncbi:hypothetical protein N9B94_03595 [Verrucomicrobia bacterium]|nr:hypothetical protein [Verrucomicrobiota bacterium]